MWEAFQKTHSPSNYCIIIKEGNELLTSNYLTSLTMLILRHRIFVMENKLTAYIVHFLLMIAKHRERGWGVEEAHGP